MEDLGKALLGLAAVSALAGAALLLASRFGLGRLPGDVMVRRGSFRLYAPVGLMIALSVVLTLVLNVVLTLVLNLFSRR